MKNTLKKNKTKASKKAKQSPKTEKRIAKKEKAPPKKIPPSKKALYVKKVKEPAKKEKKEAKAPITEENDEKKSNSSSYIFYKNPKYFKMAKKLSNSSPEEVQKLISKANYKLSEKIHVGNLMCGIASGFCQHGVKAENYCYSPAQKQQYETNFENLMQTHTVEKLKQLMVLNDQPKTATKNVLCERVADAMVLGKIPKCPSCLGGRLRFNNKTGEYYCPGFIDGGYFYSDLGDDYIFCNKKFAMNEIKREEWKTS